MESGDSETGVISLYALDCVTWCTSMSPLNVLARDLERHTKLSFEYEYPRSADILMLFARGLRRLVSPNSPTFQWLDVAISYPKKCNFQDNRTDPLVQCFQDVITLQANVLLDEKEAALKCAETMSDVLKACMGQPYVPRALFYRALTYFSMADEGRKYLREAHRALIALRKKFVDNGNINCVHMVTLLEAEVARLKGDAAAARQRYADAIMLATRSRHTHDAGICNECAGKFYVQIEDPTRASFHMEQAIKCFTDWGADAVAQRLKDSHSALIANHSVAFLSMGKADRSTMMNH